MEKLLCHSTFHEHEQRVESLVQFKGGRDDSNVFISSSIDRTIKVIFKNRKKK